MNKSIETTTSYKVRVPEFLTEERKQELIQDINALAKKYSLKKVKIEALRYKMLFETPSLKALRTLPDPTQVIMLKAYRPKMKIQGIQYAPKVGPDTPFKTPEEAFKKLTARVKKRFKNNRDNWSEERRLKKLEYQREWNKRNPDKLEAYKLRRQARIQSAEE